MVRSKAGRLVLGVLLVAGGVAASVCLALISQGSPAVPRGEPPVSGIPEFPSIEDDAIERAWDVAQSVGWVAELRAQGGEHVSARPITDHGTLVGVLLIVSYPAAVELPGPWILDICGSHSSVLWSAPTVQTVGYFAAVDLLTLRLIRLLPLNNDGGLPSKADLVALGGEAPYGTAAMPIADLVARQDCGAGTARVAPNYLAMS